MLYANKTNKPTFATGAGLQFLVYYWSTGMLQAEVINGNEKGSDLATIYDYNDYIKNRLMHHEENVTSGSSGNLDSKVRLEEALFPNKSNYIFLDHSNGDFYYYNNLLTEKETSNVDTTYSTWSKRWQN